MNHSDKMERMLRYLDEFSDIAREARSSLNPPSSSTGKLIGSTITKILDDEELNTLEINSRVTFILANLYRPHFETGRWDFITFFWPRIAIPAAERIFNLYPWYLCNFIIQYGVIYTNRGNLGAAASLFEKAHTIIQENEHPRLKQLLPHLLFEQGLIYVRQGQISSAKSVLVDCINYSTRMNKLDVKAVALVQLANTQALRGDFDTAYKMLEESELIWHELGEDDGLIHTTLDTLGKLLLLDRRYSEAKEVLERCLVIKQRVGNRDGEAHCSYMLAEALMHLGDLAKSEEMLNHAIEVSQLRRYELQDIRAKINAQTVMAKLALARSDRERALILLLNALEEAERNDLGPSVLEISWQLFPLLIARGRLFEAVLLVWKAPRWVFKLELKLFDLLRLGWRLTSGRSWTPTLH